FGFTRIKCPDGSRSAIHEDDYETVSDRIVELTKELTVGNPTNHANYMGPVIDQAANDKIMSYIEMGKQEGTLLVGGDGDDRKGWFVNPTVFEGLDPQA